MKRKCCWIAQEYKKGFKVGFCLGNDKTRWIKNIFFKDTKFVEKALKANLLVIYMANSKFYKDKKTDKRR